MHIFAHAFMIECVCLSFYKPLSYSAFWSILQHKKPTLPPCFPELISICALVRASRSSPLTPADSVLSTLQQTNSLPTTSVLAQGSVILCLRVCSFCSLTRYLMSLKINTLSLIIKIELYLSMSQHKSCFIHNSNNKRTISGLC